MVVYVVLMVMTADAPFVTCPGWTASGTERLRSHSAAAAEAWAALDQDMCQALAMIRTFIHWALLHSKAVR
ncbi:hypothetical protein [Streptomyces coeruleorubidus]|uniref:hypothetical protein n=1 Tax=Streptomyces coeruleorubidus TaxID=116188 RepID=UPI003678B970